MKKQDVSGDRYPKAAIAESEFVCEGGLVRTHRDLRVYQRARALANEIFRLSKSFPKEELYSLTRQIRDSSRSVAANIGEAWRKRRYPASFVSKLSDAEGEAGETQVWLEFASDCDYVEGETASRLIEDYEKLIGSLVGMAENYELWTTKIKRPKPK